MHGTSATRRYDGLPEPSYPFHDRTVHVTRCGRICLHRKKNNLRTVFAGQAVGIKEVEEWFWKVKFRDQTEPTSERSDKGSGLPGNQEIGLGPYFGALLLTLDGT